MKMTKEKSSSAKIDRIVTWCMVSIAVVFVAAYLMIVQPGGDGVLGSVKTPDGSEYVVEQKCNWGAEPYTVAFYMRSAEGNWGWCYIDHEASRWRDVEVRFDEETNKIVVTEQGVRRASLDRGTNIFWLDNGSIHREVLAPQSEGSPKFFEQ